MKSKNLFAQIVLCCMLFDVAVVYTQDRNIHQKWIWMNKTDCHGENLSFDEYLKWNVDFRNDNKAIITRNKSHLKGESKYELIDDKISMNGTDYSIEKLNKDSLILGLTNCERLHFVSRRRLLEDQSENFFKYKGDTIYFSTDFNGPAMIGYTNYMDYFTSKLPGLNYMEGECLIKLQFIVRKDGTLSDARGSISCHKNPERTIENLMTAMRGQWRPMYLNNEAVNTLMRIHINHSGTVVRSLR